jgi:hypothetical protein
MQPFCFKPGGQRAVIALRVRELGRRSGSMDHVDSQRSDFETAATGPF